MKSTTAPYRLLGALDTGSAITEAMLAWKGAPYVTEDFPYDAIVAGDPAVAEKNPLSESPTLVSPDGEILTETAAIALLLDEHYPAPDARPLLPPVGSRLRARALRYLVFIVANVYPTFTFGDDPSEWVKSEPGRTEYDERVRSHRISLWRLLEAEAFIGGPWWLEGSAPSAIDFYVAMMVHWTPGRAWFRTETPRLSAIADRARAEPALASVFGRHFRVAG